MHVIAAVLSSVADAGLHCTHVSGGGQRWAAMFAKPLPFRASQLLQEGIADRF
ncbi:MULTISPECIES: hypothetical protein [unclassified Xanthobacter]|uniref:hypothetical protein n=1 Tax=unclassified Xanthobacter TaxID=2623496 RepID=UPI001F2560ED|nr:MULTISPECIES: hypothetical protein [unclassified Xanthobacter]